MPYTVSWYIENRVLLITISGRVTLEDLQALHNDSYQHVLQSSNRVHAIADLSAFEGIPTKLSGLSSVVNKEKHPNQGMTVLVLPNLNVIFRFVGGLILQTLRLEYRVCQTMDEAVDILQRVDTDIPTMRERIGA